jgi:translation initiation factor IF-2
MYTVAQSLSDEAAEIVASDYGYKVKIVSPEDEEDLAEEDDVEDESLLTPRPPVITIMGHVDHGKTLLLDKIRQTDVVAQEHGGITQHIGAYQVHKNDRAITFIDTPGHEAFTQMRARGAQATDIAVLVVAADDGVKPQTVEALSHAKAANVPIVVAVNKIDKPGADPTRVRQQLTELELVPEEWGGNTPFVDISAKAGTNIEDLLDVLLLVADIQDLKANEKAPPRGVVIEAHLDKGRGPVATVLVQRGTLRVGDIIVSGTAWARVRAMLDDVGKPLNEAGPGSPAQVLGFNAVPEAGDDFRSASDERNARQTAQDRESRRRVADMISRKLITLEDVYEQAREGELSELNVILKADVQGSLEAVQDALEKLKFEDVVVRVIHRAVGAITENDVTLAEASGAIILGFNVRPDPKARAQAEQSGVEIRTYQIIYKLVEDVEAALKGMLKPIFAEEITGRAQVRATFKVPKIGTIAGCYMEEGKATRGQKVRLLRDGVVVTDTTVSSLRRFKDDVREVAGGYEFGAGLENYQDVKEGDVLEFYEVREVPRD